MSLTTASARAAVRRQIQDGLSADATPIPYNLVRLENLADQIPAVATPTQKQFMVRFAGVPTEQYATVFVVPGTLVAYLDGSATPATPTVDVDRNGNFTLAVAPVSDLAVTYGWQYFGDGDIDGFVDAGRSWLQYDQVATVPDGLGSPLVKYASARALDALARKCTLADVRAGDAGVDLSALAKAYQAESKALDKAAVDEREMFSRPPERYAPAAGSTTLAIDPYQPKR